MYGQVQPDHSIVQYAMVGNILFSQGDWFYVAQPFHSADAVICISSRACFPVVFPISSRQCTAEWHL